MLLSSQDPSLTDGSVKKALDSMILSPSGWRGVFTIDGDGENPGKELSPPFGVIAAAGAAVFADYLKGRGIGAPVLILGRDTRPTGEAMADIMIRAFLGSGCTVLFTGVSAAPEIMAYARSVLGSPLPEKGCAEKHLRGGFCYISASHNPIGHNGLKFGLDDGGVLDGAEANKLIAALKDYLNKDPLEKVFSLLDRAEEERVREVHGGAEKIKTEALAAYRDFTLEVIGGAAASPKSSGGSPTLRGIAEGLKAFPLGIAADFNGSARTVSIDRDLCRSLGISFRGINDRPGDIAHAIIPEGPSLEQCRSFLEKLHGEDPAFILGYVPDCDGDRGNLVIWDEGRKAARSLEAQEVFALACMAELAHLVRSGKLSYDARGRCLTKAAVAVNGPTSLRIDRIAEAFGVRVFRAEVGEANVVNLARRLRKEGYLVRILGEGSNGGNITHPSAVRDPLATIFALVKLMAIRSGPGLFDIWREKSKVFRLYGTSGQVEGEPGSQAPGSPEDRSGNFTLSDIIVSLPAFTTTGVDTPEAKLRIAAADHALLKEKYQGIFEKEWERKKNELQSRFSISSWEARACTGAEETRNLSRFADAGTGGLKIVFKNSGGRESAFIWMRGSKTEPVFRIMADAEGGPEAERELAAWQRAMTAAADKAAYDKEISGKG
jgi:phosphoglucomutase